MKSHKISFNYKQIENNMEIIHIQTELVGFGGLNDAAWICFVKKKNLSVAIWKGFKTISEAKSKNKTKLIDEDESESNQKKGELKRIWWTFKRKQKLNHLNVCGVSKMRTQRNLKNKN